MSHLPKIKAPSRKHSLFLTANTLINTHIIVIKVAQVLNRLARAFQKLHTKRGKQYKYSSIKQSMDFFDQRPGHNASLSMSPTNCI